MRYLVGLFSLFLLSALGCIESSVKPIDQRSVTYSERYVFTNQVFPKQPYTHLKITTDGPMSDEIIFTELNSIWHEQ
ncbi:MAG: hypothetical protein ACPGAI_08010 [Flavobacteriaceae bacterium]